MREALRLTQAGDATGATRMIQAMLAGGKQADAQTEAGASPALVDGGLIDLTAETVHVSAAADRPTAAKPSSGKMPPEPATAGFADAVFRSEAGVLHYKLFLPTDLPANAPLLVMLHGCTQTPDDFARGTGMNAHAAERGFAVAWPAQAQGANVQRCWNWFEKKHQARGKGEPALLAGMTQALVAGHGLDGRRVFIAGLSAGGAAAAVMAAAYPDVYAGVGVHSGLACGAASDMAGALKAMNSGRGGKGKPRGFVPTIVFHGDADTTVNKANGEEVFADAVAAAGGLLTVQTNAGSAGGAGYRHSVARDASGRSRAEKWSIKGGQHAWSGGSRAGSYADPRGPDASREMVRFFLEL